MKRLIIYNPGVLVEIGARSLIEPYENRNIQSIVDEHYPDAAFKEAHFPVQTVIPEKTLLEKMILLHEEFKKAPGKIRTHRMSRHLYDIHQISNTIYGEKALMNSELFNAICRHRELFTPTRNVNYQDLRIENLNFIPPAHLIDLFRDDYKEMQSTMIFGDSLGFDLMIEELKKLRSHF